MMRSAPALLAALALLSAGACKRTPRDNPREVAPSAVRVDYERANLRRDQVGHDQWASEASFVLVDAENLHASDLLVTLGGALLDAQGAALGTLRPASLRIPAGGVRTFALVDAQQQVRPGAVRAEVRVLGAQVPGYQPSVVVTDGAVHRDGERVVVGARIHNRAERPVRVLVLGGFHDAEGRPVERPFSELYLPGNSDHAVQFVGPEGSVSGYVFLGDAVF
ncbi:hypothetical protein [Haliangium ochraceum]|uniref:Lipoprotein n=1 Tax=Haliangium ochraceum (strain DSM 14365 / JCM 11303 / SMP-2) TaxID=502025 RepID=D0LRH2_HALO1|nr:hypothetical protein [Haliangium ochraceum]ACY17200.1 hypothetical protein Hoch_4710 [Haliangium ochraceum DSM 14365]